MTGKRGRESKDNKTLERARKKMEKKKYKKRDFPLSSVQIQIYNKITSSRTLKQK